MTKTIAQLWRGEIRPLEYSGVGNAEIRESSGRCARLGEKLEAVLGEDEKAIFIKYQDSMSEYIDLLFEQAFCNGFSLAAKLTAEALTGAEELA